jgi:hypothetical protein
MTPRLSETGLPYAHGPRRSRHTDSYLPAISPLMNSSDFLKVILGERRAHTHVAKSRCAGSRFLTQILVGFFARTTGQVSFPPPKV